MFGFNRLPALCFLGLIVAGSSPASATIDVTPTANADTAPVVAQDPPPSVLRLKGSTVHESPQVIILQYELQSRPAPFPGGCFNCSTLQSNQNNSSYGLSRSHDFSQDLYSGSGQRYIFLSK